MDIHAVQFPKPSLHMAAGDVVMMFRNRRDGDGILVQTLHRNRHLIVVHDVLGVTNRYWPISVRPEQLHVPAPITGEGYPTTLARAKVRSCIGENRWVVVPATGEMLRVATLYDLWLLEHPVCAVFTELRERYKLVDGVAWMTGEET